MLAKWDPWNGLFDSPSAMERRMRGFWGNSERMMAQKLAIDIRANDDGYLVEASVPGLKPEDVEVTLDQGMLTIRGQSRGDSESGEGEYVRRERWASSVFRQIALPAEVKADEIKAQFENGVLTIRIPRAEKAQPLRIPVGTGAEGSTLLTGSKDKVLVEAGAKN